MQYLWVENLLLKIGGAAVAIGFGVAALFLFAQLMYEKNHSTSKILMGSLTGALLIAVTTLLSLVVVIGLSILAGVNITAFSDMSFVLSVGYAVEYAVHIVHRFLEAPNSIDRAFDRVEYAMSFLALPTFMAFISSTAGVVCLAFTEFAFCYEYFFVPLIIVMFVTYFYGCWFLPVVLTLLDFDFLKLGEPVAGKATADEADDAAIPMEEAHAPEQAPSMSRKAATKQGDAVPSDEGILDTVDL